MLASLDEVKKYFTVGDLKKHLKNFADDLPIGQSDWMGEFSPLYKEDFYKSNVSIRIFGKRGCINGKSVDILCIHATNIELCQDCY